MELTQLNPKIERHLIEVQKILDRDPAVRRKWRIKMIFSALGLLVLVGIYSWFFYFFRSYNTESQPFFMYMVISYLALMIGAFIGILIASLPKSLSEYVSTKDKQINSLILKLFSNCQRESHESTELNLSAEDIKLVHKIQKTRWICKMNLVFAILFLCTLVWLVFGYNSLADLSQYYLNFCPKEYFVLFKWSVMFGGVLYGLAGMLLMICFENSCRVLVFHLQDSPDQLLLKLRKLEREICEKDSQESVLSK